MPDIHFIANMRFTARRLGWLAVIAIAMLQQAQGQSPINLPGLPPAQRPSTRGALPVLSTDINAILEDRNFTDATWGVSVISCDNGETLYSHNDRRNRQVASNVKLVTTAAALYKLGGDHRYWTDLYIGGAIQGNGELSGNVVIRCSGDPSISPSFGADPREIVREWARTLDSLGIRSIQNVVVDASQFDDVPYAPGWAWDDESFGFNAQISAAAIYDNSVEVTVTPGKMPGDPVSIDISPSTAYVTLKVTAMTSRRDSISTIDIRRERGTSMIVVSGNVAAGADPYVQQISVENPPLFFATLVREEFNRFGIVVHGEAYDSESYPERFTYQALRKVGTHRSPTMREIVAAVNKYSLNLAAEMLVKTLGREYMGVGSTSAGLEVMKGLLAETGIDNEHIRLYDGSGLSRQDMMAPADISGLLRWTRRSPISQDFTASLAIAGVDGTLSGRLRGTLAERNAVGKTGYLGGVRALSGFIRTRDGELLAFAIITNNYSVPTSVVNTAQDLILMRLASFSRRG